MTKNLNKNRQGKIAYIVSMRAGLEAFIYRELEALEERGVRFSLFATKFKSNDIYGPKEDWECCAPALLDFVLRSPLLAVGLLRRSALAMQALKDGGIVDFIFALYFSARMTEKGVSQIHCHFGDRKFFIGYYCKLITSLPLSVTIHAHEFYTNPNSILFAKSLALADKIYPIAEKWCEKLEKEYGVAKEKIELNRLFVDDSVNKPKAGVTLLAVGRFTERKGFHYLIQALSLLQDLDAHLAIVGFGDQDLKDIARQYAVQDRVTIFSKMDQAQLRYFYQSCDILCVPSITTEEEGAEGIPVVLMEGMACGIPVVATPCGAIEELVPDILVEERSVQQLADAIRIYAEDPALRMEAGRRNREIVQNNFSVSNIETFLASLVSLSNDDA